MTEVVLDRISQIFSGQIYDGKLRLRTSDFMFKQELTGKVDNFPRDEIISAEWICRALGSCLRVKLKNGDMHRYDSFNDRDLERITAFFKKHYDIEITKKEICYKGTNWGDVEFNGNSLEFKVKEAMTLEVPMDQVYNATLQNEEIIIEFTQDDESALCLSEMRLYTPLEEALESRSKLIYQKIKRKAGIVEVTGDSLVQFSELQCLQPRGRYDFKFFQQFIHLHGKSYDFKVPKTSIMRVMLLPDIDDRNHFIVVNVQPPLKLGQTSYHFVIVVFDNEEFSDVDMNCTEQFLEEKYESKLTKHLRGPSYEIISRLFRVLYGIKITMAGSFSSCSGHKALQCTYKTSRGLLYPLERGFMFLPKPAVAIRFEEIVSVQFSRGSSMVKSFDFEVETKNGLTHTFMTLDKKEYEKMYDYVRQHNLVVKNVDSAGKKSIVMENWSDDDADQQHDAYMHKVKEEAMQRDDDDDDSEDDDFKPPDSDAASKSLSGGSGSGSSGESSSSSSGEGDSSGDPESDLESPVKKSKAEVKKREASSKPAAKKAAPAKKGAAKDPNRPSRPPTAYMLWFNENRQRIAAKLGGGVSVIEVAKKAGELWREIGDSEKAPYNAKVEQARARYETEMKEYNRKVASGEIVPVEASTSKKKSTSTAATKAKKSSPKSKSKKTAPTASSSDFKSKEVISTSESSEMSDLE